MQPIEMVFWFWTVNSYSGVHMDHFYSVWVFKIILCRTLGLMLTQLM